MLKIKMLNKLKKCTPIDGYKPKNKIKITEKHL